VFDRIGTLSDITALLSEAKVSITAMNVKAQPDKTADINLTLDVPDVEKLNQLLKKVDALRCSPGRASVGTESQKGCR
jgi:GTP pyrophosphokinase